MENEHQKVSVLWSATTKRGKKQTFEIENTKCLVSNPGDANGDGISGDGAIIRKQRTNRSALEAFSSWKTLARQKQYGAVTSPSMKLFVAQRAMFQCVCHEADHSRNVYARWRRVFLRRSTHACVARTLRPPCTAVERERTVISTRSGFPHIVEKNDIETVGSTFRRWLPSTTGNRHHDGPTPRSLQSHNPSRVCCSRTNTRASSYDEDLGARIWALSMTRQKQRRRPLPCT